MGAYCNYHHVNLKYFLHSDDWLLWQQPLPFELENVIFQLFFCSHNIFAPFSRITIQLPKSAPCQNLIILILSIEEAITKPKITFSNSKGKGCCHSNQSSECKKYFKLT
jgi:hypothetical protein